MSVDCIFLAAGEGTRTGLMYPKQFHPVYGKPLMIYPLSVLQEMWEIKHIWVAANPDYLQNTEEALQRYKISKAKIVPGGSSRQISVFNCLDNVTTKRVIIQPASRPHISAGFIRRLLDADGELVTPVEKPVYSLFFRMGSLPGAGYHLAREEVSVLHCPQLLPTQLLIDAHRHAQAEQLYQFPEDFSLIAWYLNSVKLKKVYNQVFVTNPGENQKVTYSGDLLQLGDVLNEN
ncbi:2-C-methyl-D-erythritol 4-phosphate cytidylyltransferase [Dethiobacter alkaliphilus]|uniref:2-C-methyl-D-erythritol 4-phosphate cytidylyltransferase n=1 Tax=Dethiobacter alkaliphilus TaxID=427926 RepID=UPI0022268AE5|nr:2-C-methyl-D-erythritol 4-phosphate cytidylyltransferase [Dethiobacter alkaliphilus]MCW3489257.1 2-C-methyl-D-erythritol 4-phosphate cytidylyltransferase [Dethiobacter alkaliphilus]